MSVSFSIIIPVYNTEHYLEACLNSLISQLQPDDEIILVNDGSTDGSGNICEKISKQHTHFLQYINKGNKGPSSARNVGIASATKDYVLFIDSDDMVKDNYLTTLRSNLSDNKEIDVLMFGFETFPDGRVVYPGFSEGLKRTRHELLKNNLAINRNNDFCFSWRFAIKRSYISQNDFRFDEGVYIGEDYLFNSKALLAGGLVYVMREALYMYRVNNAESIMRRKYKPDLETHLSVQYMKKLEIIEQYDLHSVPGWDFDFSWYYINVFRDMLLRNLYYSAESDKICGLKRVLSLPLITDNYRTIGIKYLNYSKKAALFHFCCKYRVLLRYVDYKMKKDLK